MAEHCEEHTTLLGEHMVFCPKNWENIKVKPLLPYKRQNAMNCSAFDRTSTDLSLSTALSYRLGFLVIGRTKDQCSATLIIPTQKPQQDTALSYRLRFLGREDCNGRTVVICFWQNINVLLLSSLPKIHSIIQHSLTDWGFW